jgi:S1-C subfamily serine protease
MAMMLGSVAGFTVSHVIRDEESSPIATSTESSSGVGSFFFHRRGSPLIADRMGKNADRVKEPFRKIIENANASTVRIRGRTGQLALGVVVDARGYVLSKQSELQGPLRCVLPGGREHDARVVAKAADLDLAVVQVAAPGLRAVRWMSAPTPVGSWVAVPGGGRDVPLVIGVVGSPPREIPQERAILGVLLAESTDGPKIERVLENSMAEEIGLKSGDVISAINRQSLRRSRQLIDHVAALRPGDRVDLEIVREGTTKKVDARLGRMSELLFGDVEFERELDRGLSVRRSDFPLAFQHDGVLHASQCGGPVVNVRGEVVGINIARSGRIATLVLPSSVVQKRLPQLIAAAQSIAPL